ncbi:unnamed protein product [Hermetia illucens]|uniref:Uncharacterized protein n=1 Tax=Hermetia illucens TaxID=343691 RepID=A0A7R8UPL5_HERIL|nr:unnamed protein product [Hermetia illucens]
MFRAYGSLPNCEDASLFLRNPLDAVSWVSPLMMGTTADSSGTLKAAAKENFHFTLGCNLDNRPLELNEIVENDLFHEDTIKGFLNCNSNTLQSLAQLHGNNRKLFPQRRTEYTRKHKNKQINLKLYC